MKKFQLQKVTYHRIAGLIILLLVIPTTIYIQTHIRPELKTQIMVFLCGLAPNFLAGIGVPFLWITLNPSYRAKQPKNFFIFSGNGLALIILHEYERFTVGQAFHWLDILATIVGLGISNIIFFFLIKKLEPYICLRQ